MWVGDWPLATAPSPATVALRNPREEVGRGQRRAALDPPKSDSRTVDFGAPQIRLGHRSPAKSELDFYICTMARSMGLPSLLG